MATIQKLTDMTLDDECTRVLMYGPAGCGKTTLVGTFPKPILIFDFDQKLDVLAGVDGIDVLSYPLAQVENASKVFGEFKRDWRKYAYGDNEYKTVCLDSLTSYDTVCLRHFVIAAGKGATEKATLPVYGDQSGWYSYFFTESKAIPKHLVVTAHETYSVDDDSGSHSIQPLVTGRSILGKLPAMFKEVWYMSRTRDDVTLHYAPFKKAMANSITLKGSGSIKNPSYDEVIKLRKK